MTRGPSRRGFEQWFPTLARYCGVVLIFYAALVDMGRNPALIPAATGLIFLKNVVGGGD